jgi:hypothetical protein
LGELRVAPPNPPGACPVTYGFFQLVNVIPEIAGAIGLSMFAIFGVAYLITGRWTIN